MAQPEQQTTHAPTKQMLRRIRISRLILVVVCFALVVGQLGAVMLIKGDQLRRQAVLQQLSDIVISPNRGQIYDASMKLLAQTIEVCTVIMCPKNIPDEATRLRIADEVSVILEIDRQKLYEQTQDTNSQYKEIARRIDKNKGDAFIEWANSNQLGKYFYIINDYKRNYPMDSLLSSTLGFVNTTVGTTGTGAEGLESYYDSVLSGTAGRLVTALNAQGDELPNMLTYKSAVDAKDGNSLVLTVDQYIQQVTEKYLQQAITASAAKNRGCAIVMDVNTGAILAIATKNDYDLNNPRVIADADEAARIAQLAGDEYSQAVWQALTQQWRNKAVSDFYEPGSVFKAFTAAIALEENIFTEKSTFNCIGYYSLPGVDKMKCHVHPNSHGKQDFTMAISNSCNPALMEIGLGIGSRLFYKYYVGLGFIEKSGVDVPGESNVSSVLYHDEQELTDISLATSAIGQTFKVTPLQVITAMCSIANGGKLMQPYIVDKVIDSSGNTVSQTQPVVRRQVFSQTTAERVTAMLAQAVNGGGAKNAYVAGYRVAGKTGTAEKTDQVVDEDEDKDVWASFVGFAPSDNPQVAVLMMVDTPTVGQYGGTVAAPYAKKIYEEILPYWGIEPEYTQEEIARLNTSAPNVEGRSLKDAQAAASKKSLKVQVLGKGKTVLQQVPAAGTALSKDGTLVLYTDVASLEQTVTVPDLTDRSLSQVNSRASALGLNIIAEGISTSQGRARSARQSVAAGTKVLKGTVITVEFIYQDATA